MIGLNQEKRKESKYNLQRSRQWCSEKKKQRPEGDWDCQGDEGREERKTMWMAQGLVLSTMG